MKVLICGYRGWDDSQSITRIINLLRTAFYPELEIVAGGAPGADSIAAAYAKTQGIKTTVVTAKWDKFRKAAGPIRNRMMLDLKPDFVIAFHQFIQNSKGTKDCVNEAERRGIRTFIVKENLQGEFRELMEFVNSKVVPK